MKTMKIWMMFAMMVVGLRVGGFAMNLTGTKSSPTVYDPNTGIWYSYIVNEGVLLKNAVLGKNAKMEAFQWGGPDFMPVTGDFDNSGRDSYAAYHKPTGDWYVLSPDGEVLMWQENWGYDGALPSKVQGDLDGDGLVDLVVYGKDHRGHTWSYVRYTNREPAKYGVSQVVFGDFNGTGINNLGFRFADNVELYVDVDWQARPTRTIILRFSVTSGSSLFFTEDINNDGIMDVARYCKNQYGKYVWEIFFGRLTPNKEDLPKDGFYVGCGIESYEWGFEGGIPAVGDYNGDGFPDLAVIDPNTYTWYIAYNDQNGGFIFPEDFPQWGFKGAEVITK